MKVIFQHDKKDCGVACLSMIIVRYNKYYPLSTLRNKFYIGKDGISLLSLKDTAENIGFGTIALKLSIAELCKNDFLLPAILHWGQNHFVVLHKISKCFFTGKNKYTIVDPAHGIISLSEEEFKFSWCPEKDKGIVLFLEPTDKIFNQSSKQIGRDNGININHILKYIMPYKLQIIWIFILLFLGTLITFTFPMFTQKLIDDGVGKKNISLIFYILLAQLSFFIGNIIVGIIRNKKLLEIGARININIISDFFEKLFSLPIRFFDTKLMGDFNQRIQDHQKIERFITSDGILTIFSIVTLFVFLTVLGYYDVKILVVYFILTGVSLLWFLYWLKKRKHLDYFKFQRLGENQDLIYEIINGVSEMKLNQYEEFKRKEWKRLQYKLYEINSRILKIEQIQYSGFDFINQFKNILITFLSAYIVVKGQMTLGVLLSISYILGQLNSPVNQMVMFFRSLQDAKLSLERLNEVQSEDEEEREEQVSIDNNVSIKLENVSFQYEGPKSPFVLKNINIVIPKGKTIAIVGASGSGKTTLIKLLLKFYEPTKGSIFYGENDLKAISPSYLRKLSGVVMQDGFIFSDTIERNIATSDVKIDYNKLNNAIDVANIKTFIEELPLGVKTKIGASGNEISGGQKQRVLIARAVYKNPKYIFFDEATSALDAENEKAIHDNLQFFLKGKTAVIIAHRLSTVKKADNIIVLNKGEVVEQGNHKELVSKKGIYYNLIKNQLELGN